MAQAPQPTHRQMVEDGYVFIGYHGAPEARARDLVQNGPSGSPKAKEGCARGEGLYVAARHAKAKEYAERYASYGEDENGVKGARVLQVYMKKEAMKDVKLSLDDSCDCAWGMMATTGDPHGDATLGKRDGNAKGKDNIALSEATEDLEIVCRKGTFGKIKCIDVTSEALLVGWPKYDVKDNDLLIHKAYDWWGTKLEHAKEEDKEYKEPLGKQLEQLKKDVCELAGCEDPLEAYRRAQMVRNNKVLQKHLDGQ